MRTSGQKYGNTILTSMQDADKLVNELSGVRLDGISAVFVNTVHGTKEVAMDLEGVDLSRSGEVCILQLSDGETTWVIDILTLGERAFAEGGLRNFFQDPNIILVGFDGRADADALYHLHSTNLFRFYDVQIASCNRKDVEEGRRDRFVHGLRRATASFLRSDPIRAAALERIKKTGIALFDPESGGSYDVWKKRPMPKALFEYAAADVSLLLDMKRKWENYSPTEENIACSAVRINNAVIRNVPAKGKEMALKDF